MCVQYFQLFHPETRQTYCQDLYQKNTCKSIQYNLRKIFRGKCFSVETWTWTRPWKLSRNHKTVGIVSVAREADAGDQLHRKDVYGVFQEQTGRLLHLFGDNLRVRKAQRQMAAGLYCTRGQGLQRAHRVHQQSTEGRHRRYGVQRENRQRVLSQRKGWNLFAGKGAVGVHKTQPLETEGTFHTDPRVRAAVDLRLVLCEKVFEVRTVRAHNSRNQTDDNVGVL